jgi:putative hydrolase of HD superfamily
MTEARRLEQQIHFIVELDKLKHIQRRTILMDRSRTENDAEHSWHLAVMAILLSEYARGNSIDMLRVLMMVVIHDIVEIDAGDTFCYDDAGQALRKEREEKAAERIFGLLPDDQTAELKHLWEDFEAGQTPEAQFAAALDRLHPLLHNYHTQGCAWKKHGVSSKQVLEKNSRIADGAPALWEYAKKLIKDSVQHGYLSE